MSLVWEYYPEGGSKLLTMLALADFADDQGRKIFPTVPTLATKIRMSERQTQRLLHELVEADFLELTSGRKGGRNKKNHYRIKLETVTRCHPLVNKRVTNSTERVTPRVIKGDTISPERAPVSQSSGEPSEPSYNHRGKERLNNLRLWIKQLKDFLVKNPEDESTRQELDRASSELSEYEQQLNATGAKGPERSK
jgi:hypothetical protein